MNIKQLATDMGAFRVGTVLVEDIQFLPEFRKACESNSCGMYGRCWTCPPYIGDINELIVRARSYKTAVVYQTVHVLEDSYDIEGMLAGGERHNHLAQRMNNQLRKELDCQSFLHLGAGGCRVCEKCAKSEDKPCRFPQQAMASLEAYGVAVSELAKLSGMNYINGQNTVTYFGAVLLK